MSADLTAENAEPPRATLREVLAALRRPKIALALAMGLATGMPFVLTGLTLGYWLREEGLTLQAIGFLSWIGLFFSLKFLWAPVIDRADPPLLGKRLGRLRGWMTIGQVGCILGLAGMAVVGPQGGLGAFAAFAMVSAFFSATQDVAVDCWRIEIASDREQDLVAASYVFGLRGGYFSGEVGMLLAASAIGWQGGYGLAAAAGLIGLVAALLAREPQRSASPTASGVSLASIRQALFAPLHEFVRTHGRAFGVMAALVGIYFVPDIVIVPMLGPLYIDLGYSREQIAGVRVGFGLTAMLAGVLLAGALGARFGTLTAVAIGAALIGLSNLGFAVLALSGGSPPVFAAAVAGEGFASGFATVAMVTWAGRLTSTGHSATQFALLSSLMTLLGQALRGFSGTSVEALQRAAGADFAGYAAFFGASALLCAPVVMLVAMVSRVKRSTPGAIGAISAP